MISKIRLNNWKSHLYSEIEFSHGVNALLGINGSGKTSVMQAISFALFGTFSGLSSRKLALNDLIMKKPQNKDDASVELFFKINDKEYSIKRVVKRDKGTSEAEIRENGNLLEVNPHGVTTQVNNILQTDYDLFTRAVYSEQNGLDYFLRIPKGQRMQQIDAMLKLDRYEKAREEAVKLRNRMEDRRLDIVKVMEDFKDQDIHDKIKTNEKEINEKIKEKEKIQKELNSLKIPPINIYLLRIF